MLMTVMWVKIINYQFIQSIKFTSNEKIILVKPSGFSCFRIITGIVRDRNKCCHNLTASSLLSDKINISNLHLAWISLDRRREGGTGLTETRAEKDNNRREAWLCTCPPRPVQDNFTLVQLSSPAAPGWLLAQIK